MSEEKLPFRDETPSDTGRVALEDGGAASGPSRPPKKMSEYRRLFLKCVAVLACIALAAGLLLGFVHQITAISDEERAERAVKKIQQIAEGDFTSVDLSGRGTELETGRIGYLFADGSTSPPTYAVVVTGYKGYGGDIEFYVILRGDTVTEVRAGSNKETPGISDNALKNESFLDQFKGKTVEELRLSLTEGNDIDSASGATYSSRGTKNAMLAMAQFMSEYLRGGESA